MHIGPEKANIIYTALEDAIDAKMKRCVTTSSASKPNDGEVPAFVAVELGTYCGYASIFMARSFYQIMKPEKMICHLYTTEINRAYAEVATDMIQLSGMSDLVSVHAISYDGHETDVANVVSEALNNGTQTNGGDNRETAMIDFLLIDHDKDSYKTDLCKLEDSGMIQNGTKVVADNVLFAGIDDYLKYMQQMKVEGVVETRTIPCNVEYSGESEQGEGLQSYQDGVGKFCAM